MIFNSIEKEIQNFHLKHARNKENRISYPSSGLCITTPQLKSFRKKDLSSKSQQRSVYKKRNWISSQQEKVKGLRQRVRRGQAGKKDSQYQQQCKKMSKTKYKSTSSMSVRSKNSEQLSKIMRCKKVEITKQPQLYQLSPIHFAKYLQFRQRQQQKYRIELKNTMMRNEVNKPQQVTKPNLQLMKKEDPQKTEAFQTQTQTRIIFDGQEKEDGNKIQVLKIKQAEQIKPQENKQPIYIIVLMLPILFLILSSLLK